MIFFSPPARWSDAFLKPLLLQVLMVAWSPQPIQNSSSRTRSTRLRTKAVGSLKVYDGDVLVGRVNCINTDENRAHSLWKITHIEIDGSGHGDSQNVSGRSSVWSKYRCTAVRVDLSGNPHPSGEVLNFSNDGYHYVKDFCRVKLH